MLNNAVCRLSLVQVGKVVPQDVTQPSELSCALVGQAKLEGSSCCHGIQGLQPGVVPQDIQDGTIGFPQELEPGCDMLSVNSILEHTAKPLVNEQDVTPVSFSQRPRVNMVMTAMCTSQNVVM